MARLRLLAVAALAVLTVTMTSSTAYASAPRGTPTARSFPGNPTVGPIFRDGLAKDHGCTASVVASPGHDLILTAAHCVYGDVTGWQFAPGYHDGKTPYGVWTIEHAYVTWEWSDHRSSRHDFAILTVAPRDGKRLQDVTGANRLGYAPRRGTTVTDIAYNDGIDDRPVRCMTRTYDTHRYPTFNCHGYVGGSSGSPWLKKVRHHSRRVVVGVIGGLHQGGCHEYTSYSSAFHRDIHRLLRRAEHHLTPDVPPRPGSAGC